MRSSDLSHANWRKSSRSNGEGGGNCVEVAKLPDLVVMRDSKDATGPVLALARAEWRAFLGGVRTGEFS